MRMQRLGFWMLVIFVLCFSACKKADDGTHGANTSKPEDDMKDVTTFPPELLADRFATMDYMLEMPRAVTGLRSPSGYTVVSTVAVECANEATYQELQAEAPKMLIAVHEALATRDLDFVHSLSGKQQIKEDIIAGLRERLDNGAGIKQVYFQEFRIGMRR